MASARATRDANCERHPADNVNQFGVDGNDSSLEKSVIEGEIYGHNEMCSNLISGSADLENETIFSQPEEFNENMGNEKPQSSNCIKGSYYEKRNEVIKEGNKSCLDCEGSNKCTNNVNKKDHFESLNKTLTLGGNKREHQMLNESNASKNNLVDSQNCYNDNESKSKCIDAEDCSNLTESKSNLVNPSKNNHFDSQDCYIDIEDKSNRVVLQDYYNLNGSQSNRVDPQNVSNDNENKSNSQVSYNDNQISSKLDDERSFEVNGNGILENSVSANPIRTKSDFDLIHRDLPSKSNPPRQSSKSKTADVDNCRLEENANIKMEFEGSKKLESMKLKDAQILNGLGAEKAQNPEIFKGVLQPHMKLEEIRENSEGHNSEKRLQEPIKAESPLEEMMESRMHEVIVSQSPLNQGIESELREIARNANFVEGGMKLEEAIISQNISEEKRKPEKPLLGTDDYIPRNPQEEKRNPDEPLRGTINISRSSLEENSNMEVEGKERLLGENHLEVKMKSGMVSPEARNPLVENRKTEGQLQGMVKTQSFLEGKMKLEKPLRERIISQNSSEEQRESEGYLGGMAETESFSEGTRKSERTSQETITSRNPLEEKNESEGYLGGMAETQSFSERTRKLESPSQETITSRNPLEEKNESEGYLGGMAETQSFSERTRKLESPSQETITSRNPLEEKKESEGYLGGMAKTQSFSEGKRKSERTSQETITSRNPLEEKKESDGYLEGMDEARSFSEVTRKLESPSQVTIASQSPLEEKWEREGMAETRNFSEGKRKSENPPKATITSRSHLESEGQLREMARTRKPLLETVSSESPLEDRMELEESESSMRESPLEAKMKSGMSLEETIKLQIPLEENAKLQFPQREESKSKIPEEENSKLKNSLREDSKSQNPQKNHSKSKISEQEHSTLLFSQQEGSKSQFSQKKDFKSEILQQEGSKSQFSQKKDFKAEILHQQEFKSEIPQEKDLKSQIPHQEDFKSGILQQEGLKSQIWQQDDCKSGIPQREDFKSGILQQEGLKSQIWQKDDFKSGIPQREDFKSGILQQEGLKSQIRQQDDFKSGIPQKEDFKSGFLQQEGLKSQIWQKDDFKSGIPQKEDFKSGILQQEDVKSQILQQELIKSQNPLQQELNPSAYSELTMENHRGLNRVVSEIPTKQTPSNESISNSAQPRGEPLLRNSNHSKSRQRPKSLNLDSGGPRKFRASDYFEKSNYSVFDADDFHSGDIQDEICCNGGKTRRFPASGNLDGLSFSRDGPGNSNRECIEDYLEASNENYVESRLDETSSTENEALDVLLELDEVLDECLKDFDNENTDDYRLNIQISVEELEGNGNEELEGGYKNLVETVPFMQNNECVQNSRNLLETERRIEGSTGGCGNSNGRNYAGVQELKSRQELEANYPRMQELKCRQESDYQERNYSRLRELKCPQESDYKEGKIKENTNKLEENRNLNEQLKSGNRNEITQQQKDCGIRYYEELEGRKCNVRRNCENKKDILENDSQFDGIARTENTREEQFLSESTPLEKKDDFQTTLRRSNDSSMLNFENYSNTDGRLRHFNECDDSSTDLPFDNNFCTGENDLSKNAQDLEGIDLTIEECLHDLDEYLRSFDDDKSLSPIPLVNGYQNFEESLNYEQRKNCCNFDKIEASSYNSINQCKDCSNCNNYNNFKQYNNCDSDETTKYHNTNNEKSNQFNESNFPNTDSNYENYFGRSSNSAIGSNTQLRKSNFEERCLNPNLSSLEEGLSNLDDSYSSNYAITVNDANYYDRISNFGKCDCSFNKLGLNLQQRNDCCTNFGKTPSSSDSKINTEIHNDCCTNLVITPHQSSFDSKMINTENRNNCRFNCDTEGSNFLKGKSHFEESDDCYGLDSGSQNYNSGIHFCESSKNKNSGLNNPAHSECLHACSNSKQLKGCNYCSSNSKQLKGCNSCSSNANRELFNNAQGENSYGLFNNSTHNTSEMFKNSTHNTGEMFNNSTYNTGEMINNSTHNTGEMFNNSTHNTGEMFNNSTHNTGEMFNNSTHNTGEMFNNSTHNTGEMFKNSTHKTGEMFNNSSHNTGEMINNSNSIRNTGETFNNSNQIQIAGEVNSKMLVGSIKSENSSNTSGSMSESTNLVENLHGSYANTNSHELLSNSETSNTCGSCNNPQLAYESNSMTPVPNYYESHNNSKPAANQSCNNSEGASNQSKADICQSSNNSKAGANTCKSHNNSKAAANICQSPDDSKTAPNICQSHYDSKATSNTRKSHENSTAAPNTCPTHHNSKASSNTCKSIENSRNTVENSYEFFNTSNQPELSSSTTGLLKNSTNFCEPIDSETPATNHCKSFNNSNPVGFNKSTNPSCSFNNPIFARDTCKNFGCSVREATNPNGGSNSFTRKNFNGVLMTNADDCYKSNYLHQASNADARIKNTEEDFGNTTNSAHRSFKRNSLKRPEEDFGNSINSAQLNPKGNSLKCPEDFESTTNCAYFKNLGDDFESTKHFAHVNPKKNFLGHAEASITNSTVLNPKKNSSINPGEDFGSTSNSAHLNSKRNSLKISGDFGSTSNSAHLNSKRNSLKISGEDFGSTSNSAHLNSKRNSLKISGDFGSTSNSAHLNPKTNPLKHPREDFGSSTNSAQLKPERNSMKYPEEDFESTTNGAHIKYPKDNFENSKNSKRNSLKHAEEDFSSTANSTVHNPKKNSLKYPGEDFGSTSNSAHFDPKKYLDEDFGSSSNSVQPNLKRNFLKNPEEFSENTTNSVHLNPKRNSMKHPEVYFENTINSTNLNPRRNSLKHSDEDFASYEDLNTRKSSTASNGLISNQQFSTDLMDSCRSCNPDVRLSTVLPNFSVMRVEAIPCRSENRDVFQRGTEISENASCRRYCLDSNGSTSQNVRVNSGDNENGWNSDGASGRNTFNKNGVPASEADSSAYVESTGNEWNSNGFSVDPALANNGKGGFIGSIRNTNSEAGSRACVENSCNGNGCNSDGFFVDPAYTKNASMGSTFNTNGLSGRIYGSGYNPNDFSVNENNRNEDTFNSIKFSANSICGNRNNDDIGSSTINFNEVPENPRKVDLVRNTFNSNEVSVNQTFGVDGNVNQRSSTSNSRNQTLGIDRNVNQRSSTGNSVDQAFGIDGNVNRRSSTSNSRNQTLGIDRNVNQRSSTGNSVDQTFGIDGNVNQRGSTSNSVNQRFGIGGKVDLGSTDNTGGLSLSDDSRMNGESTNAGFVSGESTDINGTTLFFANESDAGNSQRPLSSCSARSGALTRNHAYRATIGAIRCGGGEERSAAGGSRARAPDNVTSRRPESSSVVVADSMATGADGDGGDAKRPLWLRTSMRRLQPLPLPTSNNQNANNAAMDNLSPGEGVLQPPGRPISAPSRLAASAVRRSRSRDRTSRNPAGRARSSSASSRSRRPRSLSSSVSSVVSSVDSTSTPTCTPTPAQTFNNSNSAAEEANNNNNNNTRRTCERPSRANDMPEAESPLGQWPHSLSSTLAYIGCTVGIFNISRFATLSIHFGANFIFQFLIITFFIGLPIFTLQLCLGQQLGAGVIDMWKISPMFQGVGVSLLFFQALTGIYSIIGVSWMFVYFRDSFVTKFERYRWAEPFIYYRDDIQPPINGSYKLTETVPDYLSGIVFQRHHLVSGNTYGTIKFQPAFNLAVVWMIVFVSLSKGLRSYGKVIYVFTLLPIFGTFVLCAKLLGMMPPELINNVFPETSWNEFFINPRSWLAACQEVFLTWGMLGAAVMQIASHNKNKHLLQRDSGLIAVITITILLLVAFLANTCVQILKVNGFSYQPDSFEKLSTYTFMRHKSDPLPPNLASTPVKYMVHNSFIVGDRINRPGFDPTTESGYQVLRFATELIPSTFAILGTDQVSPFWTVLFYFILILFGIAQQLAIWHCVITGIMAIKAKVLKSWETTITFFSCACGFILGLPMTTEFGIYVVYFLDLAIGGVWWLILIVLLQIIAVFMVRGRPYSGDTLVTVLFHSNNYKCLLSWAPALLSFTWNVVLPVVLMVWCIAFFKNGNFRELFIWHHGPSLEYWPLWVRQIGAMLQLIPILAVPFIAVIQSYRYLNNGPNDILDRIQLLYRPPLGEHMDDLAVQEAAAAMNNNASNPTTNIVIEDPPPKYTPPPSYTTATGARIAKMLRQSIRRSVRRIANVLGESSGIRRNPTTSTQNPEPPPPDYNAVLVEMNQNGSTNGVGIATIHGNHPTNGFDPTNSDGRNGRSRPEAIQRELATIATSSTGLTAADVASILRSSFRRSTIRTLRRDNNDQSMSSLSAENLIDSAAPIGETSLVLGLSLSDSDNDKDGNNTSSVI